MHLDEALAVVKPDLVVWLELGTGSPRELEAWAAIIAHVEERQALERANLQLRVRGPRGGRRVTCTCGFRATSPTHLEVLTDDGKPPVRLEAWSDGWMRAASRVVAPWQVPS